MSEQQQNLQKSTRSKEQIQKEKANTNAWHKKQQEKKKKKLEEQESKPVELDQKALEKAKRKQQKRLEREQMLNQQQLAKSPQFAQIKTQTPVNSQVKKPQAKNEAKKEEKKVQQKQPQAKEGQKLVKKQAKKGAETSAKQQHVASIQTNRKLSKDSIIPPPTFSKPVYTQLLTLQHHLAKSLPSSSSINKAAQSRLIHKYLDQYINPNDTILILSRTDSWQPLVQRCEKRVYLYPNHSEFFKHPECENATCTYEDVAYLMQGTITKIFIELDVVFANGTGLTQKGNENIICMANEFKIPVIGFSGTWNFNAWNFLSLASFVNKYGETPVQKYDIIENDQLEIIVLEIGSVIPRQISGHLENLSKIYRGCDFSAIKW